MDKLQVVIIGAGAAGIAAASRLMEANVKNIIILEAEARMGGRIYSLPFEHSVLDLGAQWVHGEKDNIVYGMSEKLDLLTASKVEIGSLFVSSSGEVLDSNVSSTIMSVLLEIRDASDLELKEFKGSLGEYYTQRFEQKLKEGNVNHKDSKYFLNWFEKFENSLEGSDSWFETSGKGLTEYWECEGNQTLCWKSGGYGNIFNILMNKYTSEKPPVFTNKVVCYNKEVTEISWESDLNSKLVVHCSDGSSYYAHHVIVTVSLGVLKEKASTMFQPALPPAKLKAIEGLSIGTVDKIYLKFPYRWWPNEHSGFNLLWTDEDAESFQPPFNTGEAVNGKHWLQEIFGFYFVDNHPLVLCGWIVGPAARYMETLSDEQVLNGCIHLLEKFVGSAFEVSVPPPEHMIRTKWSQNPHFRGSYSFRSMKTDSLQTSALYLAEPVVNTKGTPVLHFAGEATHEHYYSTVHGAIESGWREADRILALYRTTEQTKQLVKVVIVGAGMAGLAAAKTLKDAGVTDFVILEAANRAGGRVYSVPLRDIWVEAGAQWIHGENNEIWKLAHEYKLLSDVTSVEGEGPYLRDDGVELPSDLVNEVSFMVGQILEDCERFVEKQEAPHPASIGQYLREKFDVYLSEQCNGDSPEQRCMREELYDWHIRFQVIDNSCNLLDKLSARSWGKYAFTGGEPYVNFKSGYSSLVNALVKQLPAGALHYNSPVVKVAWQKAGKEQNATNSSQPSVTVHCENGVKYEANHVIVTSSLGYLKETHKLLFEPMLPQTMVQAIEEMGFATINKIFLDFEEPWWSTNVKGFQLIWSKENKLVPTKEDPSSWTQDLTGFDVLSTHRGVLLGWVGGKGAELVEDLSEEEVGRHCIELLQKFTSNRSIPLPKRTLRSQWHSNKFIRGGYSNTSNLCDVSNSGPTNLAEPIWDTEHKHPILLLAGEAASEDHFSTTHGAYESGQAQAKVILNHLIAQ